MRTIKELQAFLGVAADGVWGKESKAALQAVLDGKESQGEPIAGVDPRSEKNIRTLHARAQPLARQLIAKSAEAGITIKVISGTRTYAEQDALYRKRPKVTNAKAGYSNHNFGIAFDVGIFSGTKYIPESPKYKTVGAIGKRLGLEWGGDWKSFRDEPHFQLRPAWADGMKESAMLAELRKRKASGKDYFA